MPATRRILFQYRSPCAVLPDFFHIQIVADQNTIAHNVQPPIHRQQTMAIASAYLLCQVPRFRQNLKLQICIITARTFKDMLARVWLFDYHEDLQILNQQFLFLNRPLVCMEMVDHLRVDQKLSRCLVANERHKTLVATLVSQIID